MGEEYIDAPEFNLRLGKSMGPRDVRLQEQKELTFTRRGMGKSGITHRSMTDSERMTICFLYGQGYTHEEIGEKVSRTANTVKSVIHSVKKGAIAAGLKYDWREDIREKSIAALRAGLTCDKDPYKAANLGVQGLKGLGEFENEGRVQIATLLNSIPEAQRDRYVTLDTAGAIDIEAGEVPPEPPDPPADPPDDPPEEPPAETEELP